MATVETQCFFGAAELHLEHQSVPAIWLAAIYDHTRADCFSEPIDLSFKFPANVEPVAGPILPSIQRAHDIRYGREL